MARATLLVVSLAVSSIASRENPTGSNLHGDGSRSESGEAIVTTAPAFSTVGRPLLPSDDAVGLGFVLAGNQLEATGGRTAVAHTHCRHRLNPELAALVASLLTSVSHPPPTGRSRSCVLVDSDPNQSRHEQPRRRWSR
ncbi:hypothetical protein TIFTF001_000878 [Ficus carica]|uniref:Secreted protein n=1 Tax=Ficus carica TaxID=3494 RepID=A0AA87YWN4_FICCA|nr:hypothetical protein TIFTF001_000878 [Ficus carica]